jgi:hypothetical protein
VVTGAGGRQHLEAEKLPGNQDETGGLYADEQKASSRELPFRCKRRFTCCCHKRGPSSSEEERLAKLERSYVSILCGGVAFTSTEPLQYGRGG